ncbi:MAG: M23 family metallopeptidase [Holosporaceae bacterium]|nr:M23 family metallopeptidase [Holosporaceae bacterium]
MSSLRRGLCSGVLILIGYLPVLIDHVLEKKVETRNRADYPAFFRAEHDIQSWVNQLPDPFVYNGLVLELATNRLQGENFFVKSVSVAADGKLSAGSNVVHVSPIKIVSNSELAGSKFVRGKIQSNFYSDARQLGVPAGVVDAVVSKLSSRIDFRRSLKAGDGFVIIYSPQNVMLYARIITKQRQESVYRVPNRNNKDSEYYFEDGVKAAALSDSNSFAPPLKGRFYVTSPFGWRKSPFSRGRCYHSGVDLGAVKGTPVYAIIDGIVRRASYYYGYGNCVDLSHRDGYSSRYAHLSKAVVRCGERVKKGQLIGYTGSTGRSTGDHLHLELARNNKVLNPLSVKMLPRTVTKITDMVQFNSMKKQIEKIVAI